MESDRLYRVGKEDVGKLKELLTECFAKDPLYCNLIPDEDTRNRLMPELFQCDMEEFFETCEIYTHLFICPNKVLISSILSKSPSSTAFCI